MWRMASLTELCVHLAFITALKSGLKFATKSPFFNISQRFQAASYTESKTARPHEYVLVEIISVVI